MLSDLSYLSAVLFGCMFHCRNVRLRFGIPDLFSENDEILSRKLFSETKGLPQIQEKSVKESFRFPPG
jgi:hypothetical protein